MSKYNVSRRIQFIIQYVNDNTYASKDAILDYLKTKDFTISTRTLERDFDHIKSDFGLELTYSKQQNGYYIDEEKSIKVSSFFKFLELATLADIFADGLKDSHKIFEYVSFDDSTSFRGIDNLEPILIAIKQGRQLHFTHYSYYKKTYTNYTITPFILKEYINRWYVIGVPEGLDEIRTFGVDRLSDISKGKLSKLKKKAFKSQLELFDNIIGLYYNEGTPQNIVLKVENEHLNYLRSLPLHHSQQISESEEEGFGLVTYHLIPNYEFTIQLLKMSMHAEVVKPKQYRVYFKNIIHNIATKYS
ncbi:MAG: WYL domain-containing protein [Acidimicrobiia bacterium]|nr:WYL domain-containing protein [Acidimicrobiia bacterium]